MRRRDLLAGLLATTALSALAAAEPKRVYRLALCPALEDPMSNYVWSAFFGRLRQLGYTEGKNLIVDRYRLEGGPERYAEIARKAVEAKPDVIVVPLHHQLAAQVAKATSTIPIAAMIGSVDFGLVRSINRPEGNITGSFGTQGSRCRASTLTSCGRLFPVHPVLLICPVVTIGRARGDTRL